MAKKMSRTRKRLLGVVIIAAVVLTVSWGLYSALTAGSRVAAALPVCAAGVKTRDGLLPQRALPVIRVGLAVGPHRLDGIKGQWVAEQSPAIEKLVAEEVRVVP